MKKNINIYNINYENYFLDRAIPGEGEVWEYGEQIQEKTCFCWIPWVLFKPNLTLQPNLQNPTNLRIIHFRDTKKTSKFLGQDWRLFDCKEPEALILMCRKTAENNTRFLNAISSAFVRAQRPRRWVAVWLPWRPGALTSSVGWSSAQRKLDVWDRRRRGVTRLSNQARRTKRRRRRKKRKKRRQRKKRRPKRAVQFVCGAMQTFQ